jgi:type II secretory pathway pseudopilin PulG
VHNSLPASRRGPSAFVALGQARADRASWSPGVERPGGEAGLTLLELVVAITLLALIMGGVATSVGGGLNLARNNRNRSIAANLAAEEMDVVRSSDFTSLAPRTVTQTVDGVDYVVRRDLTWVAKSATTGPCDGSGGTPQVLRVSVRVSWPDMGGVPAARSDTVLTPPVGAYDPNSGHIAVKVLNRDAQPQDAAVVTISGPQNKTLAANSDGCAFFAFLPAGTYTVTLNTAGYVDRQSNANPTQTLGVNVGVVSSVQFDYDQAASINATLAPTSGGVLPSDIPVSLANTYYLPNGKRSFPGSGSVRTIANLFPALEGYEAWAGSCADADPEGIKIVGSVTFGPYWPGAARAGAIAPAAGGSAAVTIPVPTVTVHVVDSVGGAVAGATVSAVHAADNICTGETHVLGTTDGGGNLQAALPYGNWTLQVAGRSAQGGTWPVLVVDPNASTTPTVTVGVV